MTMPEPLTLGGCAPTPLASYLKALGVLRLISSDANHVSGRAADPNARGWWENERFHVRTRLDRDALCRFFLYGYAPSPIIAPWNGGSGFYPKDNKDGFGPLTSENIAKRFIPLAKAIKVASHVIARRELTQSPKESVKFEFVAALRAEVPDEALDWIDAALALSGDRPRLPATSGHRRKRRTTRFHEQFHAAPRLEQEALGDSSMQSRADPRTRRHRFLRMLSSAHAGRRARLGGEDRAVLAPGAAGGPNATAGYEGTANVNPWDFALMLEGAIAFAGAATRRHQGAVESGASFPFTVRLGRRRLGWR